MKRVALVTLLLLSTAQATEPPTVDIIDFFADGHSYIGKVITIRGCHFANAFSGGIDCLALQGDSIAGPTWLGTVLVDGVTLERESLRRALRSCAGPLENPGCIGDLTGKVVDIYAAMGLPSRPELELQNATIHWLDELR